MKLFQITKMICILGFFLANSIVWGQLADEAIREMARNHTSRLGQSAEFGQEAQITRGALPGMPPSTSITVHSREALVRLDAEGKLLSYADLAAGRMNPRSGQERFPNESALWTYAEGLINAIDVPSQLTRVRLERRGGDVGGPPSFLLRFEQKPYGYKARGGNVVSCFIQRITGRILELHIGRGWTYEQPNIRISPQVAKETAARTLGGNADGWTYDLSYWTSPNTTTAPQIRDMNQRKTMRLCYVLGCSPFGAVTIDSVTGDVVSVASPGSAPTMPDAKNKQTAKETTELRSTQKSISETSTNQQTPRSTETVGGEMGLAQILLGVIVGLVFVFGGLQIWKMRGR